MDGQRIGQCPPEGSLQLDTEKLGDGYHGLRIVAVEDSLIESQGRLIRPVMVRNRGGQLDVEH